MTVNVIGLGMDVKVQLQGNSYPTQEKSLILVKVETH